MIILSDSTKIVETRRHNLAKEILKRTFKSVYECPCGIRFQVEPLDIKYDDLLVDYDDFGVRCPHCKKWFPINYHIEWPASQNTFDDMVCYLIQEIKAVKKKYKAALKACKKDKSGGIKCLDSYME